MPAPCYSAKNPWLWCLITLLLWVMGMVMVAHYNADHEYAEETARARLVKLASAVADQEPPQEVPAVVALFTHAVNVLSVIFIFWVVRPCLRMRVLPKRLGQSFARAPPYAMLAIT